MPRPWIYREAFAKWPNEPWEMLASPTWPPGVAAAAEIRMRAPFAAMWKVETVPSPAFMT